jgi:Domain of unknown function (DUF4430)
MANGLLLMLPAHKETTLMRFNGVLSIAILICCVSIATGQRLFAQEPASKATTPSNAKTIKTVALVIELPGDVELHYKAIPFTDGMTVFDLMTAASKHSHALSFKHSGAGEFAFLHEIEGVKNEGASGKNWTYQVDGQRAKVGMGSMKLKVGNHVLWRFAN